MIIGEVFGEVHQLGGSTEVDMYKMSVIGHFFLEHNSNASFVKNQCIPFS
jgi:hypothetical protein